jgi:hypothetical protein
MQTPKIKIILDIFHRPAFDLRGVFKSSEIWILRANGYEYIEIPLGISPHTHILNQRDKRRRVEWWGLLLANAFPLLFFREFAVLRWLSWESSASLYKVVF